MSAKGVNLPPLSPAEADRYFVQDPQVSVQLLSDTGACRSTAFDPLGTKTNNGGLFKAEVK